MAEVPTLSTDSEAHGSVIFVGGIGVWPGLAQPVFERVKVTRPSMSVCQLNPLERVAVTRSIRMENLVEVIRHQVQLSVAPVTLIAESFDATLVLALALDPPSQLASAVVHEPCVGHHEPDLFESTMQGCDRFLSADDPADGAEHLVRHLIGDDSWSRLHPSARGYTRYEAPALRTILPLLASWDPDSLEPGVPIIATVGRQSSPMRHRAALALADAGAWQAVVGRGHLVSVDAPSALADIALVAINAAEVRFREGITGRPMTPPEELSGGRLTA